MAIQEGERPKKEGKVMGIKKRERGNLV